MSSRSPLEQLRRLDTSSPEFHDRVSNILGGGEYREWVSTIEGDDLVGLVGYLDRALDKLDSASSAFRKCLRELRRVCGAGTTLPPSHILSPQDLGGNLPPIAQRSSGDLYEGSLKGVKVRVKRIRVHPEGTKIFYQEVVVWKHLKHRNIVPLIGITSDPLQLISEQMPGGDLVEYIKKLPDTDRVGLLSDVAEGLHFLHSYNIVHGDLKGQSILVNGTGRARITDFGLAMVTQYLDSVRSASEDRNNMVRWTAPEILKQGTRNKEADIFSFAMVMVEVFTGAVPFSGDPFSTAAFAILSGKRPPRPKGQRFTDQLWTLMQRCWDEDPLSRPEVSEVFKILRGRDPPPIKSTIYRPTSTSTLRGTGASDSSQKRTDPSQKKPRKTHAHNPADNRPRGAGKSSTNLTPDPTRGPELPGSTPTTKRNESSASQQEVSEKPKWKKFCCCC